MRVCELVRRIHVLPGAIRSASGWSGPDGSRRCTVTDSLWVPGLNTSSSPTPPAGSWLWGMTQCACGAMAPGRRESPVAGAENACSSDATTRPVRVATTVLTEDMFCTSEAMSSTWSSPGDRTMPW